MATFLKVLVSGNANRPQRALIAINSIDRIVAEEGGMYSSIYLKNGTRLETRRVHSEMEKMLIESQVDVIDFID
jgi:hypothetical protein